MLTKNYMEYHHAFNGNINYLTLFNYGYVQVRKLLNYQRVYLENPCFFFTNNLNLVVSTSSGGDHPIVTLNGRTLCGPVDRNAQSFTGLWSTR